MIFILFSHLYIYIEAILVFFHNIQNYFLCNVKRDGYLQETCLRVQKDKHSILTSLLLNTEQLVFIILQVFLWWKNTIKLLPLPTIIILPVNNEWNDCDKLALQSCADVSESRLPAGATICHVLLLASLYPAAESAESYKTRIINI